MVKYIFCIFITAIILANSNCRQNPVTPQPPLDTTSHNFTWTLQTLGGASGSVLYDVAIVNDTLAYAVGEMYLNDSVGQIDPQPYNLARWDGKAWRLQKVPYYYQSQAFYGSIYSLLAFNASDIWFGIGNMIHWDGQIYNPVELPSSVWGPHRITKIWGSSSRDFYTVGDGGSIAHYNGSGWTKITSGTTLQFNDIWGGYNSKAGQWDILAVCSQNYPFDRAIYSIKGNSAAQISTNPIQYELFGVWFAPNQHYYVVGDGIYEKNSITDTAWKNGPTDITRYATTKVRGNNVNDVFVVGAFGEVLHYNGSTWHSYISTTGLVNGSYSAIAVRNNLAIAVGANSPFAVVAIGKRE